MCRRGKKRFLPQWLRKSKNPLIFLCAGCREQHCHPALDAGTPQQAGWEEQSEQLSCTMSSQPFSTDRRATAWGDLHHQLMVSITLKQGFSKAKGFQLHRTSPPRAAGKHKEGPFAGGFHPCFPKPFSSGSLGTDASHPRGGCISSVCPRTPLQRSASKEQQGC